ncbi:hypothetical protein N431DRAFT_562722, partial [Stipitochalara longipes BDJ]
MPCINRGHAHPLWPGEGMHEFIIEACENHCGWCDYQTKSANNLRVHANRHLKNEPTLKDIKIVKGTAGRKKLQIARRRFEALKAREVIPSGSAILDSLDDEIKIKGSGRGSFELNVKSNRDSSPIFGAFFSPRPDPSHLALLEQRPSMQDPLILD